MRKDSLGIFLMWLIFTISDIKELLNIGYFRFFRNVYIAFIHGLFGEIPDVQQNQCKIDSVLIHHPFELSYHVNVGKVNWEPCIKNSTEKRKHLTGWK